MSNNFYFVNHKFSPIIYRAISILLAFGLLYFNTDNPFMNNVISLKKQTTREQDLLKFRLTAATELIDKKQKRGEATV